MLILAAILAASSSAHGEPKRGIGNFRLSATADETLSAAPQDCWEQEVYYFCDAGSYMVLYTPDGLSWTVTFAWEYSGPFDSVAERVSTEYQVELARDGTSETYLGAAHGLSVTLTRAGTEARLTVTDTALAVAANFCGREPLHE
jgi:hypothetical protein